MFLVLKRCFSTINTQQKRSIINISLTGRDFIKPCNLSCEEIKSLLWTALDLKLCSKNKNDTNMKMNNVNISLLLHTPKIKTTFALQNAAQILNAHLNTIVFDENLGQNYVELGKMLNCFSDIIFCEQESQNKIQKIADGASCPVITVKSYSYSIIQILADMMTIQEKYGHLKGLKFCWIGLHGPLVNTYLSVLSRFGLDINFFCVDKGGHCVSPCLLHTAMETCRKSQVEIHEFSSVNKAIYRCDVIATNRHRHDKIKIKQNDIEEAAVNWSLFGPFPRGKEMEDHLFNHKNCLTLRSLCNLKWIYMSIIIRFLKNYNHVTQEPPFDDIEAGYVKK